MIDSQSGHITVSHDVTFDERFKSAIAMTHRPFPGAQHIRQIGPDTMSVLLNDTDDVMHTGSVDDILHTRHGTLVRGGKMARIYPPRILSKIQTQTTTTGTDLLLRRHPRPSTNG